MKINLSTTQVQKQILAPIMQQSIEILLLPIINLNLAIDQELQNNPLLEIDEEKQKQSSLETESQFKEKIEKLLQNSTEYDYNNYSYTSDDDNSDLLEPRPIKCDEILEDKLLQQLKFELSNPEHIKIGEYIIGNINEDGYLTIEIIDIANNLNIPNTEVIEQVLNIIQSFDPIGIGSRNLKECLLVQAREKLGGETSLAYIIVNNFLNELGQKKYNYIAKKAGVSVDEVKKTAKQIASLDPKPARNYRPIRGNIYIKPDIVITKSEEIGYQIHLNKEGVPPLRISPTYKNLLKRQNINDSEKEFIHDKLKNALNFIKSIEQRGQTIKAIAEYILNKQSLFFEQGPMALVPMALKDVAKELNRNESTISRAINNKYIDTPQGLFPLKYFFSQSINKTGENGDDVVSNRSIKEEIKDIIETEDKSSPLSDQEITKHFEDKGMKIARRTISKYRKLLKILPSHLRKE